jgi:hypothetical protein
MAAKIERKTCPPIISADAVVITDLVDMKIPKKPKKLRLVPLPMPVAPMPVAPMPAAPVIPAAPIAGFDFWNEIKKIIWYDRAEGKNIVTPSWIPQYNKLMEEHAKKHAEALQKVLVESKIFDAHAGYNLVEMQMLLAYHIVAKGWTVYKAVMETPEICVAFMHLEEDFQALLK